MDSLVFAGGGVKGIAYIGALKVLEAVGRLKGVRKFAGSSAGSIVAGLLAIGYTPEEMETVLSQTDFTQFKDRGLTGIIRLDTHYGFYAGDYFLNWISKLIEIKTGNGAITLKEIYDTFNTEVVITGTSLNTSKTLFFHYKKYPDLSLRDSIRMSMSIPGFFAAVNYNGNVSREATDLSSNRTQIVPTKSEIIVDGGTICNYPIEVFDSGILEGHYNPNFDYTKSKTLGMKFHSSSSDFQEINSIETYLERLIDTFLVQIDRGFIREGYTSRTVFIDPLGISTTQFSLTPEQSEALIKSGTDAMLAFLT